MAEDAQEEDQKRGSFERKGSGTEFLQLECETKDLLLSLRPLSGISLFVVTADFVLRVSSYSSSSSCLLQFLNGLIGIQERRTEDVTHQNVTLHLHSFPATCPLSATNTTGVVTEILIPNRRQFGNLVRLVRGAKRGRRATEKLLEFASTALAIHPETHGPRGPFIDPVALESAPGRLQHLHHHRPPPSSAPPE